MSGIATEGQLAPAIATQFVDVTTYFMSHGVSSDPVTMEQLFAGEGGNREFSIDSRNLLKATLVKEERLFLGGLGALTRNGNADMKQLFERWPDE